MFAKLYDSKKYGQILVKIDSDHDEGNPEVRFFVQPDDMGVCACAIGFVDSDEGWDSAEEVFNGVTLEKAEEIISKTFDDGPVEVTFSPS